MCVSAGECVSACECVLMENHRHALARECIHCAELNAKTTCRVPRQPFKGGDQQFKGEPASRHSPASQKSIFGRK